MAAYYEIKRTFEGCYYFELRTAAARYLLRGGERTTLALCRRGIGSMRVICDSAVEDEGGLLGEPTERLGYPKFVISKRGRGVYTVALWARNGKKLAESPDCPTVESARNLILVVQRSARHAPVRDEIGGIPQ